MKFSANFLLLARPTQQKIDFISKQFKLSPEQMELCIAADPSPNQTDFVAWLAKQFSKQLVRLPEDTPRLREQLSTFLRLKRTQGFTGNKDINGYASPAQLSEVIERNELTAYIRPKEQAKLQEGAEVFVQQGDILVYKVTSPAALSALSDSTDWCTRHEETAAGYLNRGPSYIVFYKGKAYAQLHYPSNQYMDRRDAPLCETFRERGRGWGNSAWRTIGKGIWDPIAIQALELVAAKDPKVKQWVQKNVATDPEELKYKLRHSDENQLKLALITGEQLSPEAEAQLPKKIENNIFSIRQLEKYADKFHPKGRWEPLETSLLKSELSDEWIAYAKNRIGGRWPELETRILKTINLSRWSGSLAIRYCIEVLNDARWPELEQRIQKAKPSALIGELAFGYANKILHARWPQETATGQQTMEFHMSNAEYSIAKFVPERAVEYAKQFIGGRWPEFEQLAMNWVSPQKKVRYWRSPDGQPRYENTNAGNPYQALVDYAEDVIKGRDPAIENALLTKQGKHTVVLEYALRVIKGRWPEYEKGLLNWAQTAERDDARSGSPNAQPVVIDSYSMPSAFERYITEIIKNRWSELETILLNRYQTFPNLWVVNQNWLGGYLGILDRDSYEDWPEGTARFYRRSPEYEAELLEESKKEYHFNSMHSLKRYFQFLESVESITRKKQNWLEGEKRLMELEDESDKLYGKGAFPRTTRRSSLLKRKAKQ